MSVQDGKRGVSWAPVDTDRFSSEFSPMTLKLEANRDPERCETSKGQSLFMTQETWVCLGPKSESGAPARNLGK